MTQKSELKPEHIYAVIAVIFAFVAYQAFVVVPQNKIELQKAQDIAKEVNYNSCVESATEGYTREWNGNCTMLNRGDLCALPMYLATPIEKSLDNEKNRCVTMYK